MAAEGNDLRLQQHARGYERDPEFMAEGLSTKVIEEALKFLEEKELSQSWLADRMGVSRAYISRILKAPPNITLLTIARIAVALGATPSVSLNAGSRPADASSGGWARVLKGRSGDPPFRFLSPRKNTET